MNGTRAVVAVVAALGGAACADPQAGALVDGAPTASVAWAAIEPKPATEVFPPDVAYRFMTGLGSPAYHDGVRKNCQAGRAVRAGLILDVESTDGALEVRSVSVNEADPGDADERQRLCVARWMAGTRVEIPGLEAGRRYRVLTKPKF